jgi:4-alpha-glucanotransferase
VTLEDVIGEREQANLPGTVETHPNWTRKLSAPLEDLRKDLRFRQLAAALGSFRTPNSSSPLERVIEVRP